MKSETVKRICADILKCGTNKVWCDPNEMIAISAATSREKIKELINSNIILKKPDAVHSRFHARKRQAEVAKGRHRGPGKVRGPKTALDPPKKKWMKRIREMRSELRTMRSNGYILPAEYKKLYNQAKGNMFKSKKLMVEYIDKKKVEEKRMRDLSEQAAALKMSSEKK